MQYSETTAEERNEKMSQVSMRKGFWFYFEHQGHDISVHGSAWSGKETIYVDNHPVSDKRNLTSFTGKHDFVIDNDKYEVGIKVLSLFSGTIEVTLICNDKIIGVENKTWIEKGSNKKLFQEFLLLLAVGATFGYLTGRYIIPFFFD